jgi:hypothetical protein
MKIPWTKSIVRGPRAPLVHHGRPREHPRAWPPATPRLKVTGEGAGEVEEAAASTFMGSSKLGEHSCRYNEGIREHAMVQSMHLEDIRIEKK